MNDFCWVDVLQKTEFTISLDEQQQQKSFTSKIQLMNMRTGELF